MSMVNSVYVDTMYCTVPAVIKIFTIFMTFGDIHENNTENFPQRQCLVGTPGSNFINFIKITF